MRYIRPRRPEQNGKVERSHAIAASALLVSVALGMAECGARVEGEQCRSFEAA